MTVREHAQDHSTGTGSPKWNAAIINVINSTCAFPAPSSQNVCREEGLLTSGMTKHGRRDRERCAAGHQQRVIKKECRAGRFFTSYSVNRVFI